MSLRTPVRARGIAGALLASGLVALAVGCGGGEQSASADASATTAKKNTARPAKFPGFELPLQPGTYWEFAWDSTTMSGGLGGGGTSTATGRFRIVLGEAAEIEGKTLYAVDVEIVGGDDPETFTPTAWQYIGIDENRILGSLDGTDVRVIFDAQRGKQPGGGFLEEPYDEDKLLEAYVVEGAIESDYITGDALVLGASAEVGGCETFPDVGTICSETSESFVRWDYFQPEIGPVGYFWSSSVAGATGGAGLEINIGLVDHAFEGGPPAEPVEEPAGPEVEECVSRLMLPYLLGEGDELPFSEQDWRIVADRACPELVAEGDYVAMVESGEAQPIVDRVVDELLANGEIEQRP